MKRFGVAALPSPASFTLKPHITNLDYRLHGPCHIPPHKPSQRDPALGVNTQNKCVCVCVFSFPDPRICAAAKRDRWQRFAAGHDRSLLPIQRILSHSSGSARRRTIGQSGIRHDSNVVQPADTIKTLQLDYARGGGLELNKFILQQAGFFFHKHGS